MSQTKPISEKMSELSRLVEWFEGDDFELEKALDKYEEAQNSRKKSKRISEISKRNHRGCSEI